MCKTVKTEGWSRWPIGFTTYPPAHSHRTGHPLNRHIFPCSWLAHSGSSEPYHKDPVFLTSLPMMKPSLRAFALAILAAWNVFCRYWHGSFSYLQSLLRCHFIKALFWPPYKIAIHLFTSPYLALFFSRTRAVYSRHVTYVFIFCLPLLDFQLHENKGFACLVHSCIPCTVSGI